MDFSFLLTGETILERESHDPTMAHQNISACSLKSKNLKGFLFKKCLWSRYSQMR